jgi:hypothetical protein
VMDRQDIEGLIARYNSGDATPEDREELEALLESGAVDPFDFPMLAALEEQIRKMEAPAPSARLDDRFYEMLAREKKPSRVTHWKAFFSWPQLAPRLALASVTLIIGIAAGYLLRSPVSSTGNGKIDALSQQVSDLQEMMMLSLLEKGSATERLKAVNLTQQMSDASRKVTNALLQTLNHDENVNVRLAALEALKPFAAVSGVREALVGSIANQESPLVQVAMAELMVALQEKSAVREFEKIVKSDKTPPEVRKKIKESLNILI